MKKSNIKALSHNNILFEDNHLLVVIKAAGLLVQGDRTGDTPLVDLAKATSKKYNKPGEVFLVWFIGLTGPRVAFWCSHVPLKHWGD